MLIAVFGATGNTGRAVVKELRALGQNTVCVVRNADKAREVLGADAKTTVAELLPFAKDLPVALIDVRDTGAVGARILLDPAPHAGKTYEITGKLTSYGDFAEVFSSVLGRPIAYVSITPEQAEQGMRARGMPDWLVAHLVASNKLGAAGAFSTENTRFSQTRADHDQTIRRGFQGSV